jgi:hypothetical protein
MRRIVSPPRHAVCESLSTTRTHPELTAGGLHTVNLPLIVPGYVKQTVRTWRYCPGTASLYGRLVKLRSRERNLVVRFCPDRPSPKSYPASR